MRKAFVNFITDLAQQDNRFILLVADTGAIVFDEFRAKHPDKFVNCGIAEQNMIGVAAGLALSGFAPVVYGIVPFVLFRCYEQVRNDVVLQQANVKIIATGDSETYKDLGPTHYPYGREDFNLCQNMPGEMKAYFPESVMELTLNLELAFKRDGPAYIRMGKR